MISYTISQIAGILGGTTEGNSGEKITAIAKIEEGFPGSITFLANPKYESFLYETEASAVIISKNFVPKAPVKAALIRVENPYQAFTFLLQKVQELLQKKTGIEEPSFISPTAKTGKDVYIGAFCYIGHFAVIEDGVKLYPGTYVGDGVTIGKNSILYANVSVYMQCKIGESCIIHSGAVIGSDGFGHAPQADGSYLKIPQMGNVVIGNQVEVGANTTIDRATIGSTVIQDGVKLDNLIQIAHNVVIGKNTVIAAQTGISGSTKIGENGMIGGQVGIVGHIEIANGVKIGAQSGISKTIQEENSAWRGSPAQVYRQQLKSEAIFRQLETLMKKVTALEKALSEKNGKTEV